MMYFFFFSSRRRHTRSSTVSWARMCIRDSSSFQFFWASVLMMNELNPVAPSSTTPFSTPLTGCLLYTSDAADERSSVDLGGRRIIKKKKIILPVVADEISNKIYIKDRSKKDNTSI